MATLTADRGAGLSRKHGIKIATQCSVETCCEAVGDVIGEEKIIAASRMNKAVVLFVATVDLANQLVESGLDLEGIYTPVLPLSTPARKVIISGVPPFMDQEVLARTLSRHGQLMGPIRKIGISASKPTLRNIESFRRVAHMILEGNKELDIVVNHKVDNIDYMVYATSITMKCFGCKQSGHLVRACPHKRDNAVVNPEGGSGGAPRAGGGSVDLVPGVRSGLVPGVGSGDLAPEVRPVDLASGVGPGLVPGVRSRGLDAGLRPEGLAPGARPGGLASGDGSEGLALGGGSEGLVSGVESDGLVSGVGSKGLVSTGVGTDNGALVADNGKVMVENVFKGGKKGSDATKKRAIVAKKGSVESSEGSIEASDESIVGQNRAVVVVATGIEGGTPQTGAPGIMHPGGAAGRPESDSDEESQTMEVELFKKPAKKRGRSNSPQCKRKNSAVDGEPDSESDYSSDCSISCNEGPGVRSNRHYSVEEIKTFLSRTKHSKNVRINDYFPDVEQFKSKIRHYMSDGEFTLQEGWRVKKILTRLNGIDSGSETN